MNERPCEICGEVAAHLEDAHRLFHSGVKVWADRYHAADSRIKDLERELGRERKEVSRLGHESYLLRVAADNMADLLEDGLLRVRALEQALEKIEGAPHWTKTAWAALQECVEMAREALKGKDGGS